MTIPAVFFFGDSTVDTGNNNNLLTAVKVNFPPYGKDFKGGKATGRFSNGKVPADFFAEELGIKELLPAYLDPNLHPEDLPSGVNFASGGSGYDPLTPSLVFRLPNGIGGSGVVEGAAETREVAELRLSQVEEGHSVLSLPDQLELLKEYIGKLKGVVGEKRTATIIGNSLFVIVAGSNDMTNTYFINPLRRLRFDVPSYTDFLLAFASDFIKDLYGLGARRIGVSSLPPIGCLPSQRTLAGGPLRKCAKSYNDAAKLYNSKLSAKLNSLNSNLPGAKIVYIDSYSFPLQLIRNPNKYGFKVGNKGCCGSGLIEVAFLCTYTCPNASDFVFWDSFHLTERAYKISIQRALQQKISSFI
ncbi:hypothetical protein U1Q18_006013 [Sarracenia purpurea var. burkii]